MLHSTVSVNDYDVIPHAVNVDFVRLRFTPSATSALRALRLHVDARSLRRRYAIAENPLAVLRVAAIVLTFGAVHELLSL